MYRLKKGHGMPCLYMGLLSFLFALSFVSCESEEEDKAIKVSRAAYIIAGQAQTISVFDIETSIVKNDVLAVGKWPNDIQIRGDRAYVVNTGDNNVQIIDLESLTNISVIDVGVDTSPEKIGFVGDNKAYVSCLNINSVNVVDLAARKVTKSIKVGVGPWGVAVAGQKVYVCNPAYDFATKGYGEGTVLVINSATDTVVKTIKVETNPTEILAFGDRIVVQCTGNYADITGKLCVIDTGSDSVVRTIDLGTTPSGIAVSSKGVVFITSSGGLLSADIKSGSMIHSAAAPLKDFPGGSGLAIDKDGNAYICVPDWVGGGNDKLLVMDASEKLVGTYKLGGGASIISLRE